MVSSFVLNNIRFRRKFFFFFEEHDGTKLISLYWAHAVFQVTDTLFDECFSTELREEIDNRPLSEGKQKIKKLLKDDLQV